MTPIAVVFLAVSLTSLTVQSVSLARIYRSVSATPARLLAGRGLLRTSSCRVTAAVLYVAVGVLALLMPSTAGVVALGAFVLVQVLWWANSVADVRLQHHLRTQDQTSIRGGGR